MVTSCKKNPVIQTLNSQQLTSEQKELAHHFDQIAVILRQIYQNPQVREEVALAVFSNFYVDEVVKLKDLLHPDQSPLFQSKKMIQTLKDRQIDKNLFSKSFFFKALNSETYPGLKDFLDRTCTYRNRIVYSRLPVDDPGLGSSPDVTIYYPYSENFVNQPNAPISILSAHGELDGDYGRNDYGNSVWINDDYAELHPTQIIGMNGGDISWMVTHCKYHSCKRYYK